MFVQVNDMHRVRRVLVGYYRLERWQLEEWEPVSGRPQGGWRAYTRRMAAVDMDRLLVHMDCPEEKLAAFRSVAMDAGPSRD